MPLVRLQNRDAMTAAAPPGCSKCGAELTLASRFCPACGSGLPALRAGQVIDEKYEILAMIAEGGMGEVYKVRHLHLDEIRIVKTMRTGLADDDGQQARFQHEAKLATKIRHGNVASLYDFSRLGDGTFYMVWEFLDGETLQDWISSHGRMAPLDALDIALQVLDGLDAIHATGIVHRDISPDNIMLTQGRSGTGEIETRTLNAKIIDLGIAKSTSLAAGAEGRTQTGMFIGKVKYASPEQAGLLGEGERLDARSDLYSLGVTLFEMLTGSVPFKSNTPEGYLVKHIQEAPLPLRRFAPELSVPDSLETAVLRAMCKNREQRFASARDFRNALVQARRDVVDGRIRGNMPTQAMYPGPTAPASYKSIDPHAPTAVQQQPLRGAPPRGAAAAPRRVPFWAPWALGILVLAGAVIFVWKKAERDADRSNSSAATAVPASATALASRENDAGAAPQYRIIEHAAPSPSPLTEPGLSNAVDSSTPAQPPIPILSEGSPRQSEGEPSAAGPVLSGEAGSGGAASGEAAPSPPAAAPPAPRAPPQLTKRLMPGGAGKGLMIAVGSDTALDSVTLYFRLEEESEFRQVSMQRHSSTVFRLPLPDHPTLRNPLRYYFVARSADGQTVQDGSVESPHTFEPLGPPKRFLRKRGG